MLLHESGNGFGGALAEFTSFKIDAAHARVGREWDEIRSPLRNVPAAEPILLLGKNHYRPAFRRFVGQTGQLRGIRQFSIADTGDGEKIHRLPIAQRDGAGFVEQQRIHVAGGFHSFAAHGQHVVLHDAIHARDSDSRKQSANGGRDQADQQRNQYRHARHGARARLGHAENCVRLQRDNRQQEDQGQSRDQNVERDFVRGLLALGAFHQRDHAIQERFAGLEVIRILM